MVALDEIFHGVAEWGMAFDQNGLAFDDPHFDEAPAQCAGPADACDGSPLSGAKKMELSSFGHMFLFN
jgi:hypothetical protein